MPVTKLMKFLDEHHVSYEVLTLTPEQAMLGGATRAVAPGETLVKTCIVKRDGTLAMLVQPEGSPVDCDFLKEFTSAWHVEPAVEGEYEALFPYCERGAIPPFGDLYGMHVYVSDDLAEEDYLVFKAGRHTEMIRMKYEDYVHLVRPTVLHAFALEHA